jgi:acyl-CoA synthetase (NDP forming)
MTARRLPGPRDLTPLLAPRSIAVVGGSESPDSWAPEIERSLRHLGFEGELYPINPKYTEVWGRPCVGSIGELPSGGVDLLIFVIPARFVPGMIEDCAAAGVRSVMVVSSGFAEAGDEGRALQDDLAAAAARTGIPVLGPNVEGFVNHADRVAPYGTTPPPVARAGSVAVISQSGTVAWTMGQLASDRGEGLRILLGVGNEAVLGLGDLYEWAAADRATKVVVSYIETMRDVEGIGRGLDALRAARKPVVICAPAGRSEAARRSIVAHTGALAGDTALRDAWLRGHGAVLVEDPVTMFEAAVLLSRARKLRAPGVAAAFQSGGACTLFAEAAGAAGLTLPELSGRTKARLRRALPHYASQNNPLDVTGQAAVETSMYRAALEALAADPAMGFVALDAFPPRLEGEEPWADTVLRTAEELRRRTGVVFASVAMSPLAYGDEATAFVHRWKLPFLQGHHAATGAIRALVQAADVRPSGAPPRPHPQRPAALRALRGLAAGPLDEVRAARLLERYGVRRPREAVVATPAAAVKAAGAIIDRSRRTVAVKALAAELPHKAALGGVRLGLRRPAEIRQAAADVLDVALRAGASAPQILVQEMVRGHEVLVGAVVDERFGACVTLRPGGSRAEEGEPSFVAAPLSPKTALAYVHDQAAATGLDAKRHDLAATAAAVSAIAQAAHDLKDRLVSLEANPLLVSRDGAVAVDALAEVRETPA